MVWKIIASRYLGTRLGFWDVSVGVLAGCKGDKELVLGERSDRIHQDATLAEAPWTRVLGHCVDYGSFDVFKH